MEPRICWHSDGKRYIQTNSHQRISAVFNAGRQLESIAIPIFVKDVRGPVSPEQIPANRLTGAPGSVSLRKSIFQHLLGRGFQMEWPEFDQLHFDARLKPHHPDPYSDDTDSDFR